MVLYGTVHRVGDGISTTDIIAPTYAEAGDPALLAAHCLAGVGPALAEQAREGDILLAGAGFGHGPDPASAALALQALGLAAVVCATAAPSFATVAAAYGLPVLECPAALEISAGTIARLDLAAGTVTDRSSGAVYQARPAAPELIAATRQTQLLARMRRVVEEEGFDG